MGNKRESRSGYSNINSNVFALYSIGFSLAAYEQMGGLVESYFRACGLHEMDSRRI
jgi:hypothetical protein